MTYQQQPVPQPYNITPATDEGNYGLSWVRTVVPIIWGAILSLLLSRVPFLGHLLDTQAAYVVFDGLVTTVYYSVVRWVESHLPAWLTRLFIGANSQPVYRAPLPPAPGS